MKPQGTAWVLKRYIITLYLQLAVGLLWPDIVAEGILHVDESCVPAPGDLLDGVEVLLAERGNQPVAVDTLGRRALGQNDVSTLQSPRQQNLCEIVAATLSNLIQLRV